MLPHPLTNFEMQKYYQKDTQLSLKNNLKFNDVYSRNNSPKIKDGEYAINLAEFKSIGSQWIVLYMNGNNIVYFNSFAVDHIPKKIRKLLGDKNVKTNIDRIKACNPIMCR